MRFGFTVAFATVNKKAARVVQTLAASDHSMMIKKIYP